MPHSRRPAAIAAAFGLLFPGGAAAGIWLARALAPGSWLADAVSFFFLPIAFVAGLQAWYGMALLSLVLRLFGRAARARSRPSPPGGVPGSVVFVPIASVAGLIAGALVGAVSPAHSIWLVLPIYWLAGTGHGVLAWRLARGGYLLPPAE